MGTGNGGTSPLILLGGVSDGSLKYSTLLVPAVGTAVYVEATAIALETGGTFPCLLGHSLEYQPEPCHAFRTSGSFVTPGSQVGDSQSWIPSLRPKGPSLPL